MGYDTSFHPIDVDFLSKRLLPYVLGNGSLDDLSSDIARLIRVRYRANAWGLGLSQWEREQEAARPQPKPGFFGKIFGGSKNTSQQVLTSRLESDLHLWGRPFFITSDSGLVSEGIDRYMAATPATVDAVAKEMLDKLSPGLSAQVSPDEEGGLPDTDAELVESYKSGIDCLRSAVQAIRQGKDVIVTPGGDEAAPEEIVLNHTVFTAVDFASLFRPGWMARGYCWPTYLLIQADIPIDEFFESMESIFSPMNELVPGFAEQFEGTITQNYMVGGYVAPEKVPLFLSALETNHRKIKATAMKEDDWDEEDIDRAMQKIREAALDAKRRNCGFAEATEIYSGFEGKMN